MQDSISLYKTLLAACAHAVINAVSNPSPPAHTAGADNTYLLVLGQAWLRVFVAVAPMNLAGSNAASQLSLLVC
jgi:hypothetical protein